MKKPSPATVVTPVHTAHISLTIDEYDVITTLLGRLRRFAALAFDEAVEALMPREDADRESVLPDLMDVIKADLATLDATIDTADERKHGGAR